MAIHQGDHWHRKGQQPGGQVHGVGDKGTENLGIRHQVLEIEALGKVLALPAHEQRLDVGIGLHGVELAVGISQNIGVKNTTAAELDGVYLGRIIGHH